LKEKIAYDAKAPEQSSTSKIDVVYIADENVENKIPVENKGQPVQLRAGAPCPSSDRLLAGECRRRGRGSASATVVSQEIFDVVPGSLAEGLT